MNVYKKTIIALGIAFAIIPQTFAMNSIAKKNFDSSYTNHFSGTIFEKVKSRDFSQWDGAMNQLLDIAKNNSGGDGVLASTIEALRTVNYEFINAMKVGYGLYSSETPSVLNKSKLTSSFGSLIQKLGSIKDKLNKPIYILPSKREAKDILNHILNKLLEGSSKASNV